MTVGMARSTTMRRPAGDDTPVDLRQKMGELVRSTIKAAALECFREHGYRASTIRQIAKAAGTTHTTFYQYFSGKAELIVELGRDAEPALLGVARQLDEALQDISLPSIRRWVDQYAEVWNSHHATFDAYWEALVERKVAEDIFPASNKMADQLGGYLARFDAAEAERVRSRISLLFFYTTQTFFIQHSTASGDGRDHMLDQLAEIIFRALKT